MTARDLLTRCAELGIALALEAGRLRVTGPVEAVREFVPLLREHRDELLGLLQQGAGLSSGPDRTKGPSAAPVPAEGATGSGVPSDRTCGACAHRTSAGTCARPVEAGLAAHFAIRWPPAGHSARCPAFERQPQPVPDPGTQPTEPPRHPYETERRHWWPASEPELRRMAAVHARAVEFGLDPQQADCAADVLHWRDRTGDDRRLCLECRSLRAGTASRWWCTALHLPLPQQLVVEPHRCETFQGLQEGYRGD